MKTDAHIIRPAQKKFHPYCYIVAYIANSRIATGTNSVYGARGDANGCSSQRIVTPFCTLFASYHLSLKYGIAAVAAATVSRI